MQRILDASGMKKLPKDQSGLPAHQIHSQRQTWRINPFWRQEARPIFPRNATGPYAEPFPILTGANHSRLLSDKGTSRQNIAAYNHKRKVS